MPAVKKFNRKLWMQLHGYASLFFLPFACVYAISGALHIWAEPHEFEKHIISLTQLQPQAPDTQADVQALIKAELAKNHLSQPEGDLKQRGKSFVWGKNNDRLVKYTPDPQDPHRASLQLSQITFYGRMISFHKGKGSNLLDVLGTGFALLLVCSYLSGLLLALKTAWMQKASLVSLALGLFVTLACLLLGF